MGLASSQARLLNLTTRMHQIEYKAAKLEAEKLQMANESQQVYETYQLALEKTKVQYKVLSTDGSVTYNDISNYSDLLNAGYALDFNGRVYDNTCIGIKDNNDKLYSFVKTVTPTAAEVTTGGEYEGLTAGTQYYVYSDDITDYYSTSQIANDTTSVNFKTVGGTDKTVSGTAVVTSYEQLCADAFGADVNNAPTNVYEVITNLINSGEVTIVQARKDNTFAIETDSDFNIFETSVATNTGLREVTDETFLKKAEAKYEADMKKIDMKDRKFDSDLAALDAERNAIKQEMETLKTVAKENVERTFKLFS